MQIVEILEWLTYSVQSVHLSKTKQDLDRRIAIVYHYLKIYFKLRAVIEKDWIMCDVCDQYALRENTHRIYDEMSDTFEDICDDCYIRG